MKGITNASERPRSASKDLEPKCKWFFFFFLELETIELY